MSDYSEIQFYTKSTDCGTDSCLAPYVLLENLQETADNGAADTGWGRDEIGEYGCCWIVLRCRLHINRLPSWREKYTVRTWSCGSRKIFFDREYEVYDEDHNLLAGATSVWILAEKDTHKPVSPSKLESLPQDVVQSDKLALGQTCPKLKLPRLSEELKPLITKYADYTELDHNHHVNNTRYLAWVYDALFKGGYDVHKVCDININYISEVKCGQKVDIYSIESEEGLLVFGYRDDSSGVFVCEIRFRI